MAAPRRARAPAHYINPLHGCTTHTRRQNLHESSASPSSSRLTHRSPPAGHRCVRVRLQEAAGKGRTTIDAAAKARRSPLLRVRRQRGGRCRQRPRALFGGRRQRRRWPSSRRQEGGRYRCRHRDGEAAVVGTGGGHDGRLHVGRRRRGRLQHRVPRPPRGLPRRRQGPPQQRAPPPRVPPGARRAPPRAPPPHRPPPWLLRPARRRRAGAGVRAEREPARAAPRRRQRRHGGADDAVGAAGVGGAAGGPRAGVPPRAVRAAGGARRREGVQRAAGRGHGRPAVRLRVGARGVLGGRRRPPWRAPAGARRAGFPGLRGPALPPLRRGHQEERRVQLRRAPAGAAHRRAGVPRRPAPDGVRGAEARRCRRGRRRGRRARGPEARVQVRRPRGGGRGGAGGRVRRGQPEPPAVNGRCCADPGAAAARPVLGRRVHRRWWEAVVQPWLAMAREGGGGDQSDACSDIIRRGGHCGRGIDAIAHLTFYWELYLVGEEQEPVLKPTGRTDIWFVWTRT